MNGWREIESAPRDGTLVLGITFRAQTPRPVETKFIDGKWLSHDRGEKFVTPGWAQWWPTHWREISQPK